MMSNIRTIEEIVADGGWHWCGCGIPSRARYWVVIPVSRLVGGLVQENTVEWFACADHLDRVHPNRMLHPSIRAAGWRAGQAEVTERYGLAKRVIDTKEG